MISYPKYLKVNKLDDSQTSFKMYSKYYYGEQEIEAKTSSLVSNEAPPANYPRVNPGIPACIQKQEVENTMNTERDYLNRRIDTVRADKKADIQEKFNIYKNLAPRNYKEMIDWIKTGKYEVDAKRTAYIDSCEDEFFNAFDGITWTGRGKVDRAGFDAAVIELNKQHQSVKDIINTMDAEQGLKALREFEAWNYTTATKQ